MELTGRSSVLSRLSDFARSFSSAVIYISPFVPGIIHEFLLPCFLSHLDLRLQISIYSETHLKYKFYTSFCVG